MNKHILLVMKWLDNNESVTQQELIDNRKSADAAAVYAAAVYAAVYAAADAAAADDAAADAAAVYAADAEKWIGKYFERSCEHKQEYLDALKPVTVPTFTQAMADAGELPGVGIECKLGDGLIVYIIGRTHNFDKTNQLCYQVIKIIDGDEDMLHHIGSSSGNFKPLTPPIELIDGACYEFLYMADDKAIGIYSSTLMSFDNYGRKFKSSGCTYIKLLGVKS